MTFGEKLEEIYPKIFSNGYLLKQESDFKMFLEKELIDICGSSQVSTEYEFKFTKEGHETANTDIIIWNSDDKTKIDYAIEVKYHLTGGYDFHRVQIKNFGDGLNEFETDLKKISAIKEEEKVTNAYALYVTDNTSWRDSIINTTTRKGYGIRTYQIGNIKTGVSNNTTSLFFVLAYK